MEKNLKKLILNQETLRNLTGSESTKNFATNHTCVKSVCFPACTPQEGPD